MTKAHLHLQSVQRFIPLETTEDEPPESAPTRNPARCAETVAAAEPAPAAIRRSRRHESGRQLTLQCAVAGRPVIPAVTSPHAGATAARQALSDRFAQRVAFNPEFTRRTVSYQGNRRTPGLRWMKYKEGFSRALVDYFLDEYKPDRVLDPFAGIGTTALVAAGRGIEATGVEIMPIGVLAGAGVAAAANGLSRGAMDETANAIRKRIASARPAAAGHAFPHVRITEAAFPVETESALGKAREFVAEMQDGPAKTLVNLACMSVLEAVSYTRKDGQYLRWDTRSGRKLRAKMRKGPIPSFPEALDRRLAEMAGDLDHLKRNYGGGGPKLVNGSSLEVLKTLPDAAFDMVITSPPYANRYDYTRTYALELAWLGIDQDGFAKLRQQMLSATVENRTKIDALRALYGDRPEALQQAVARYEKTGGASRGAAHPARARLRARQPSRHTASGGVFPGDGGHRHRTRPSGAARRRRDHDQRQRAVSRGGSAGRLHPLRPRRAVGIHLRRHLDACAGQGEREPADGKVRATRNPQVRLPLGPEAMTARDDLMRRSKESV